MNSLISIIVPVYNSEKTLHRCIDSIINQTYTNLELLLIDDGSVDSSAKICLEYLKQEHWIRYYYKNNEGVSSARNLGVKMSKGRWITFVDSDDWIEPNHIESLYDESVDFSSCCMTPIGWQEWEKKLVVDCKYTFNEMSRFLSNNIMDLNFMVCKLFQRDIVTDNNISFNYRLSYGEDTVFIFQYLKFVKKVKTSSHASYNYDCTHANSLSSKQIPVSMYLELIDSICIAIKDLETQFCWNGYDVLVRLVSTYMNRYFKSNFTKLSISQLQLEIKAMSENSYVKLSARERRVYVKSFKRKVIDILILNKCYRILAIILKLSNKLYH